MIAQSSVIRVGLAWTVLLIVAVPALARQTPNVGEVGVGAQVVVSTRASMPQENPSIPTTGTGGTAGGFIGSIGGFPSRLVGLAVEFSIPLSVTDEQSAAKFRARHRHRDLLISGLVYVRSAPERRAQVAAVGGVSLVREDTRTAIVFPDPLTNQFDAFGPEESTTRWTMAATFGADLRVVASPHIMIVPTLRVDAIRRDEQNSTFVGLGTWTIRPGVMLRATF